MDNINGNLPEKAFFRYFEEIAKIPRCSGNEKAVSDYLVNFANLRNLKVEQDNALNVLIRKPAFPGYERAPTVILQGHMDMVCDKNKSSNHDFEKDPIKLRIEEDMLYAKDTTLGADDGVAMAYALSILESKKIPHPPLRVLITTEEEVGLKGASAMDPKFLEGDMLINVDGEEEGVLFSSSAGGIRAKHYIPATWEDPKKDWVSYSVIIKGLKGGHSGVEIDKCRGNSNKLMGRFLSDLLQEVEYRIVKINGGSKMNAIPREAEAIILISSRDRNRLETKVNSWNSIFQNELKTSDPGVTLSTERGRNIELNVLAKDTMNKIIALLVLIPNGVQTMSADIKGLVESSTNLGVVTTFDSGIVFESAIRSNVKSLKYNILNQLRTIALLLDFDFETDSDYPEWEYDPDSKLRDIFKMVYKKLYKKEPKIAAVHGGLECGFFKEKNKNLDIVSFGPNMYDVHTPNEHISISSIERTWEYLLEVLKEINSV